MKTLIVFSAVFALTSAASVFYAPAAVHVVPFTSHQHHAQDELGQYSYGYVGGPSAKAETKTLDGVTRGGYSYVDAHGLVQQTSYVADPVNGFRVAATNLPVAPAYGGFVPGPIPQQVPDSPEVASAKLLHAQQHAQAAAAAAAAPDTD